MNNELLKTQNEVLRNDISNTINYWFGLNMIDNVNFSKQTKNQLRNEDSKQYKNLYNVLVSDVKNVYSMNGVGKVIDGYSKKYEEYFDTFNKKLDDFSEITVNKIIGVIETGLQGTLNAKKITEAVQNLITEREKQLEEYLQKNIGQLENYMLLLTGAEQGSGKYLFLSESSGVCNACNDLDGKIFAVDEAVTGVNYPPIHPNYKCKVKNNRKFFKGKRFISFK